MLPICELNNNRILLYLDFEQSLLIFIVYFKCPLEEKSIITQTLPLAFINIVKMFF